MNYLSHIKLIFSSTLLSGAITSSAMKSGIKDSKSLLTIGIGSLIVSTSFCYYKFNKKLS